MSDFLLELRSEEIPARMQAGARAELEKLFRREMDAAGVATGEITVWSTPRRLALIARGLPEATEAVREEAKGPPEGAPDQAIDGFCRKNGVTRDQLELRDVKGRNTYFAVIEKPGQATKDLLADAIPAIIRDFAWPKSMRWGADSISTESLRWVRPLSGIVALLGDDVIECEVHGVTSGAVTLGHRFHHSGDITIGNADDYAMKLRAGHVIVDHEERQDAIRTGAKQVAEVAGLKLVEDEGLVIENAGLTEWPVPLLGRFDEDYLDVPPEVIQLTARVNQKYFVCEDSAGKLANAFICTANIEAVDPAVVVDGNRKVLAARLSDARFFWELDQKTTLADHAEGLKRITFHEKLGTVADKVERVAKLARWLAEEKIVAADPDLAEQAARLSKADLVTEMVGEFPELQGLMGGYYAEKEGLPQEVSDAIRDHYKPVGQGDEVPTAPVTVAVSLADKLDTLVAFFLSGEQPTGSKDPYALRRAVIAVLRIISENNLRFRMQGAIYQAARWLLEQGPGDDEYAIHFLIYARDFVWTSRMIMEAEDIGDNIASKGQIGYTRTNWYLGLASLPTFFADRLKVQQREAGIRHDLIDAVFALGGEDDLVRLLARVHALQSFMETDDGANLLAGYKRAANILKKEDWDGQASSEPEHTGEEDPLALAGKPEFDEAMASHMGNDAGGNGLSYSPEPSEKALIDALDSAEPKAAAAVEAEDFAAAMSALASLRAPIDRFFEDVIVNAEEKHVRAARLDLLARFRDAVHQVADFGRIEG
ncbi:glycyl-tRNA synthetase beta chain [Altererythrobacter xiamenensis]|uniref:Glycine--tRNA ligase beta subunit n=1 Tax=Altererythrobacter xiamenensis TaxID=1316679 RepID=A0A1Y6FNN6_9SPHN|nr:glycine--tRNA ligase subunit beta [Altererythrobacter xiamenensis]SMQ74452.1 glycyl-tRNA synthetase beta chain [Altererythrobacter xiamenensis]